MSNPYSTVIIRHRFWQRKKTDFFVKCIRACPRLPRLAICRRRRREEKGFFYPPAISLPSSFLLLGEKKTIFIQPSLCFSSSIGRTQWSVLAAKLFLLLPFALLFSPLRPRLRVFHRPRLIYYALLPRHALILHFWDASMYGFFLNTNPTNIVEVLTILASRYVSSPHGKVKHWGKDQIRVQLRIE